MSSFAFLLGLLGVVQMAFLPGFVLTRLVRLSLPLLRLWVISFACSIVINYVVVSLLTISGVYNVVSVYLYLLVEVVLLFALTWRAWTAPIAWRGLVTRCHGLKPTCPSEWLGWVLAGLTIAAYLAWWWCHIVGHVFIDWDPVVSWNMWALDFFHGHWPLYTFHYPQAIPANWSLIYWLMTPATPHHGVEFFPHAVMLWFILTTFVALWDVALTTKRQDFIWAIPFVGICFAIPLNHYLGGGWVDGPVASMAFYAGMLLLVLAAMPTPQKRLYMLVCVIIAGAAVVKQAGIYIVLVSPILSYALLWHQQKIAMWKKMAWSFLPWLFALIIAAPWYVIIQYRIDHGLAHSEIGFVTNFIYQNYLHTIPFWLLDIAVAIGLGLIFWLVIVLSIIGGLLDKQARWLLWCVAIPYMAIWFAFYIYDYRNLALALPFFGVCAGIGAIRLGRWVHTRWWQTGLKSGFQLLPVWGWMLGVVIVVALLSFYRPLQTQQMLTTQIVQQRHLGDKTLNALLYEYQHKHGFETGIITNWDFLKHLPGIGHLYIAYQPPGIQTEDPRQAGYMLNPANLAVVLKRHPARYVLVANEWGLASQRFVVYMHHLVTEGEAKVVIHLPVFDLYYLHLHMHGR